MFRSGTPVLGDLVSLLCSILSATGFESSAVHCGPFSSIRTALTSQLCSFDDLDFVLLHGNGCCIELLMWVLRCLMSTTDPISPLVIGWNDAGRHHIDVLVFGLAVDG